MSKPMTFRYAVEALGVRVGYAVFGSLSMDASSRLFGQLAAWIGPRLPVSREAEARLQRAMPELTDADRRSILRRMWNNLGRVIGEYPHLGRLQPGGPDGRIEIVGAEHLQTLPLDNGALIFSAHFGNWEIALIAAEACGVPITFVRREANNPGTEAVLRGLRHWRGQAISKGASGAREVMKALARHERLFFLSDQKMNDGIPVPFFGRDAMTAPALGRMALRFRCPVVPMRVDRLDGARFRVTIYPPLPIAETGDTAADTRAIMAQVNATIEGWVRERPDHWLWVHRRWPE
jgi:KDO2-lipid IV(A) lauroyltransferase